MRELLPVDCCGLEPGSEPGRNWCDILVTLATRALLGGSSGRSQVGVGSTLGGNGAPASSELEKLPGPFAWLS